jgi:histidinol-phosphate phosphatase family protein
MRQAVILAGGKGTRLAERLGGRPKALVDVDGIPLLQRQLHALRGGGVTDVLLLVNHEADQIAAFVADEAMHITLIDDGEPRGTAGALVLAFDSLAERFLVVYGDTLFDVDLVHFWQTHTGSGAAVSLFLHPNDHPSDSDLVELDDTGRVAAFHAAPHDPVACAPNLVNAAMYVIERDAIAFWRTAAVPSDIARDLFPAMLGRGMHLRGHISCEYIKDVGTPKRLDKATAQLRAGVVARARRDMPQAAVFLDRDGTMNGLRGHLAQPEDLNLLPRVGAAVRRLNDAEYRVVVVTNQPVLARGEATAAGLRRIHGKLEALLGCDGAFVDRIYHCPHHPDAGFPGEIAALKVVCNCRKPSPGMIDQACSELNIDPSRSWLIGDSTADIAVARVRGITSVLVCTGEGGRDYRYEASADFVAADMADAVSLILDRVPALLPLAAPLAQRCHPGDVVLVGGLARSGKSSLAAVLARHLCSAGQGALVVSLDHWLRSAADRQDGVLGRYDMAAIEQALVDLVTGRAVRAPVYDALMRVSLPDRIGFLGAPDDVLIFEGCPALLSEALCARATLRIYTDCSPHVRRQRFAHEYCRRGLSADEIDALYAARETDEHDLVCASAARADHIVHLPNIAAP